MTQMNAPRTSSQFDYANEKVGERLSGPEFIKQEGHDGPGSLT